MANTDALHNTGWIYLQEYAFQPLCAVSLQSMRYVVFPNIVVGILPTNEETYRYWHLRRRWSAEYFTEQ